VKFRPRRFGLRARITLAFALGSLLLSVTLSASTWAFTRQAQLNQREASAVERLFTNARSLRSTLLAGGDTDRREYLNGLPTPADQVLAVRGVPEPDIYATGDVSFNDLPLGLRDIVAEGQPASMRYRTSNDDPFLVVGVPLPAVSAQYFEVVALEDLERSFELLGLYLTAASLFTALGGAALGSHSCRWSTSVRLPRPSPADGSTPGSSRRTTPTWASSWRRSTTWLRRCRPASSATPGSPPTSVTSFARR
jgi:two-component system, OmpR family, sensor histidine kinase MtrB